MIRLNKRLVELGLSPARRKADEAISNGKVLVNGKPAELGMSVNEADNISLAGKQGEKKNPIYVAFNKPFGYVCSHASQTSAKTIFSLLPKNFANLKIAGRLDADSVGLILLSSDGDFVQSITHPSAKKEKEYIAKLNKNLDAKSLDSLRAGIKLDDGVSKFLSITKIAPTIARVIISEGRNRQIRRSFEYLDYKVISLSRIRIGKLKLETLPEGKHKIIQPRDVL